MSERHKAVLAVSPDRQLAREREVALTQAGFCSALFKKACELDLEGIVAKDGRAPYDPQRTTWFKIRNRNYSQLLDREELFERERRAEPVAGWHSCVVASALAVGE